MPSASSATCACSQSWRFPWAYGSPARVLAWSQRHQAFRGPRAISCSAPTAPNLGVAIDAFDVIAARISREELDASRSAADLPGPACRITCGRKYARPRSRRQRRRIFVSSPARARTATGSRTSSPSSTRSAIAATTASDVYNNDDYLQMPPETVAARAQRAAEWLGETVLRRALPIPNMERLRPHASAVTAARRPALREWPIQAVRKAALYERLDLGTGNRLCSRKAPERNRRQPHAGRTRAPSVSTPSATVRRRNAAARPTMPRSIRAAVRFSRMDVSRLRSIFKDVEIETDDLRKSAVAGTEIVQGHRDAQRSRVCRWPPARGRSVPAAPSIPPRGRVRHASRSRSDSISAMRPVPNTDGGMLTLT